MMKIKNSTAVLLLLPALSFAQVPVDDDGNVIGQYESQASIEPIGDDGIPRLSQDELRELVGPIALYPDDLLAIVLPASAYPLQVVEAARFLEALESDPSLSPDPEWDDSIVALTNYPEVVELLNEDLDWTWRLGEAVVAQQTDVVAAVESFRDVAYAAGNLKSDSYQTVSNNDGVINISPNSDDVIYVPYYEPARVVHYQPRPVYYYYPRPYPVYYYPYSSGHHFDRGYFWGVTTAFSIGWLSDSLHVYHHSYRGHPYYGRSYRDNWWYRRPSINIYNTNYVNRRSVTVNRYTNGDRWQARNERREYVRREGYSRHVNRTAQSRGDSARVVRARQSETIRFRERGGTPRTFEERETRSANPNRQSVAPRRTARQDSVENARETRQRDATRQTTTARRTQQSSVQPRSTERRTTTQRTASQPSHRESERRSSQRERNTTRTREQAPQRSERVQQRAQPQARQQTQRSSATPVRQQPQARQQTQRSSESRSTSQRSEKRDSSSRSRTSERKKR